MYAHAQVDFDATRKQMFEPKWLPGWFTSDNRLGQLCITLEPPACFSAEEYALNLDYPQAPDDFKVRGRAAGCWVCGGCLRTARRERLSPCALRQGRCSCRDACSCCERRAPSRYCWPAGLVAGCAP